MKLIKDVTMWVIEDNLPKPITLEAITKVKDCIMVYPTKALCVKACMYIALNQLNRDIDDTVYIKADDGKPMETYLSDLLYNTIALENNNRPVYFNSFDECNKYCMEIE